jgi:2-hydroxy-3-keto-5-methylthiopentenyl-1-phosphate phosphatase
LPSVGAMLVDFDGTACSHDAAEHLLVEFGDPSWRELDTAWERGELDSRRVISGQAAMLNAPLERLIGFALEHCPIDPTFPPFVRWLRGENVPVTIVSDGFGFYIKPLLEAAGVADVEVITNTWSSDGEERIRFGNGHAVCIGCGTCKMNAVLSKPGPVAFVGEGMSDRYAAIYSDLVFAKDVLVDIASADGVPIVPWETFDDVRAHLETLDAVPSRVGPDRCPGWRIA